MALVVADRVKETTTTSGTGTYDLGGVVTGFQSFATAIGNTNTTYYACTDGNSYEIGIGTYASTGNTLARTTILKSTNSNAAVNWGTSTKEIFVTYPAEKSVFKDASGDITGLTVNNSHWSGTDLAVANGGTGASTLTDGGVLLGSGTGAITAMAVLGDGEMIVGDGTTDPVAESGATLRTSIGVAIGSDVQAYDADLTALGGLAKTDSNFIVGNGSTWVAETGSTARTSLGLAIGSDVQAYDADLAALGGLAKTDSNFIVGNGSTWVAETGATVRTSLGLGTAAVLDTGISDTNIAKFTSGVADDDFLRVDGTAIEGRSASEVLSDIGGQASLTFGISNTNAVKIDSASVADDEYARFTANGLESRSTSEVLSDIGGQASLTFGKSDTNALKLEEAVSTNDILLAGSSNVKGRTYAELKSDLSLNNVENTALSSWVGTSNITTLGTIGTGTWQGSAVADSYISSASTWNAKQAALTFGIADTNAVKINDADAADNDYAKLTASGIEGRSYAEVKTDLSLDNVENTALSTGTALNATNATHVSVADNESTDENNLITFIENASATGNVGLESDGDFHYNPSTGKLTATQLAGTLQTAAQANITSVGTLTGLTTSGDIELEGGTSSINWTYNNNQNDVSLLRAGYTTSTYGFNLKYMGSRSGTANSLSVFTDNSAGGLASLEAVTIFQDGKVGINDSTPTHLLDVNGTFRVTGAATFDSTLSMGDSDNINIGAGNDLQLYHNGTNSVINNNTGDFYIVQSLADKDIIFQCDDGSGGEATYITLDGSTKTVNVAVPLTVGVDDTGHDVKFFGATSGKYMEWDESADQLDVTGSFDVTGDSTFTGDLTIISTDAGATDDPSLILYRNSSSPADSDDLGEILFRGRNDNSQDVEYAKIWTELKDASDGTEDAALKLEVMKNGTLTTFMTLNGTADQIYISSKFNMQTNNINNVGTLSFEGATDDDYETTIDVVDPTADRTITLPNATGEVVLSSGGIDTDASAEIGRVHIGHMGHSNHAGFSHVDQDASGSYALLQNTDGLTYINAASGYSIKLRNNNANVAQVDSTGLYLFNGKVLTFEGATANANETTLTVTVPTQDNTITLPNTTGTVMTSLYADYYDSSGGTDVDDGAGVVLNQTRIESDASKFGLSSGEVTVDFAGKFMINYDCTTAIESGGGNNRSETKVVLQEYNGSSWSDIAGTVAYTYNRLAGVGENTCSSMVIHTVTSGYKYRIYADRESGTATVTTTPNGSRLTFMLVGI